MPEKHKDGNTDRKTKKLYFFNFQEMDVVRGEAEESEDESLSLNKKSVLASEVFGEASESSDEDVYDKNLDNSGGAGQNNVDSMYCNNLLQRKLIENNLNIWRSLNMFVKSVVTPASKQLYATDQLLIKSQLSMQQSLVTLDQTQSNMKHLYEKSNAVFTANFIPKINASTNRM